MKVFLWCIGMMWVGILSGQNPVQDSVDVRMKAIVSSQDDSVKLQYADEIGRWLKQLPFGTYDSDKAVRYLGYKPCMNADTELFSWSIPVTKGYAFYNLFKFKEAGKDVLLKYVPGETTDVPPYLFYDLLAFYSHKELYYVLLGWGYTAKTDRKAVLIARFDDRGGIDFRHRLMKNKESRSAALTFEYGKGISMTLKHDKKGKRIIFDHLSAGEERYEGFYMFYGPDGTYDALVLKKGEWVYQEDVKL